MSTEINRNIKMRKGRNLKQVKTNADRIRNMSDEELAEFLAYNAYCEEC